MITPLYVTCLGLVCPVGLSPESGVASMRAVRSARGLLSVPAIWPSPLMAPEMVTGAWPSTSMVTN